MSPNMFEEESSLPKTHISTSSTEHHAVSYTARNLSGINALYFKIHFTKTHRSRKCACLRSLWKTKIPVTDWHQNCHIMFTLSNNCNYWYWILQVPLTFDRTFSWSPSRLTVIRRSDILRMTLVSNSSSANATPCRTHCKANIPVTDNGCCDSDCRRVDYKQSVVEFTSW